MRLWVACLALCLGGCAQLLGAEDPVAEHPIPPNIASEYRLSINLVSDARTEVIEFKATVSVDTETRELFIDPIAVDHVGRMPTGDSLGVFFGEMDNAETLDFSIEWEVDVPAVASPTVEAISWQGDLDGAFPDGTTDGFCGTMDGTVTSPTEAAITNTTFSAVKIEPGAVPVGMGTCADLNL